jgi:transposase
MPKPYSLDLRERVVSYVEAGHSRRAAAGHFRVSPSFVINLMTAFRERGAIAPKALGGWRHSKLDPHRVFILRRVAEKDDISMPELAGELQAASGVKADPASLSRWLIRNGLSFKKKPSGEPNAIGPTCARRARRGKLNDSLRWVSIRIGWCSSTRQEPIRK